MKFYFFHLMPYGALNLDYDKKYRAATLELPNSYYDPVAGAELYERYIDELSYADELGFDGVCVNEHHQTAYGLMPVPGVIAGALTRSTKKAKIAVLGRALPILHNPMSVAEEYAMLDNMSGGRLIAGFVRGIGAEYHATGTNPAFSLARFQEAHDLILRAWTETGPFRFEGEHYRFEYVNLWPRPLQQPHPPIWIPSQGSDETIRFVTDPRHKYVYLNTYAPFVAVETFLKMYRATAEDVWGYEAADDRLGWAVPAYVAETDAIARAEAKPHIESLFNKFLRMPNEMLLPPGYTSQASMKKIAQAKRNMMGGGQTLERLIDVGMFLCGSPQTVIEKIEAAHASTGVEHVALMAQFGTLPAELTRKNLEMLAGEVFPRLRRADAPTRTAARIA